jgi:integrase
MGKLTAKFVENAPPGMHSDGGGLYLQVGKGDAKSWVFRFKLNGKSRYMGLGSVTVVSLKQARDKADAARVQRADRIDPIDHRERVEATKEAVKRALAAKAMTFSKYADQYIADHKAEWKNPIHRLQWQSTIDTYAKPIVGHLMLSEVDTDAVMKVLRPIWFEKPETASRLRGRIESILDAAKVLHYREGENPARWRGHLKHLLPLKSKVRKVKHHKAVPWKEMPAFMAALRQRPSLSARMLEFIILTAVRVGSISGDLERDDDDRPPMKWSHVDLDARVWTIPATKNGAEHRVPLVGRALAILQAYTPEQRHGYVFPGNKGKPMTIAAPDALLTLMGRDETTHGFRSSFKDWADETTNFPGWVAKKALAHTIGDETDRAYQCGDLLEKRRELMTAWDAYCEKKYVRTLAEQSEIV